MAKTSTSFKPGEGGRPPGVQNVLTRTVKETVLNVFNEIQGDPKVNLTVFAKKYPREFYQIAARLIPTEIHAKLTKVSLEIVRHTTATNGLTPSITENGNGQGEKV